MEKVCHMIVDDVGNDNVFWEEIREEKYREYWKKYVHMAHIELGVHKGP